MERLLKEKDIKPNELSPLTLAFIGDTVFDLLVRESLICQANRPANDLHNLAVQKVKASAQAGFVEKLLPHLTEKEVSVYKRGRNAKSGHLPKNASQSDYHMATGFESLIGYLYLSDEIERIKELFYIIEN
ncbi:MAG: ribonuclease III domain-containing protein [Acutalibacteraceae bacterium]|nr:ribonuclease III domain-containing protein [Acutalibacteraceae bacterium]